MRVAHWNPLPHPDHFESRPGAGTADAAGFDVVGAGVGVGLGVTAGGELGRADDGVAWGLLDPPLQALRTATSRRPTASRRGEAVVKRTNASSQSGGE